MMEEFVHELGWAADAAPVVVPQRRDQPRAIGGEHQVGQDALPERPEVRPAPHSRLLRPRLDQYVMPFRIQGCLWRTGEDDVICAGIEIPKPPGLIRRPPAQQRKHGSVMRFLAFARERQQNRGVSLEDRWDGSGDGLVHGRAIGDPRDVGVCPDAPRAAIPGLDRLVGIASTHTTSVDTPRYGRHGTSAGYRPRPWLGRADATASAPGRSCPCVASGDLSRHIWPFLTTSSGRSPETVGPVRIIQLWPTTTIWPNGSANWSPAWMAWPSSGCSAASHF